MPEVSFFTSHHEDTMATETFGRALSLALRHKGGCVDHAKDPGGANNLSVTIGTLSAWLGRPATKAEIKTLTVPAVTRIYGRNTSSSMGRQS